MKTKYTIQHFRKEFPTEDSCLQYIFNAKYPSLKGYTRVGGRRSFQNSKGKQISPLKGTVFQKSSTPLLVWFEALFLFSVSKNGVSAMELQRHFGVTYKCAWRIAYQIRLLMQQGTDSLTGSIEADETYLTTGRRIPVVGAIKRGGAVRVRALPNLQEESIEPFLRKNVRKGSKLITDDGRVYKTVAHRYKRQIINKSKDGHTRGRVHVNSIEAFWSHVKRSVNGTYHFISQRHAQHYLDEFAYRYDRRFSSEPIFLSLLSQAVGR